MNKVFFALGIVVLVAIGWFLFFSENTTTYVADVTDEVAALEADLAAIDAAVQAGTFTPAEAAVAQTRIAARIESIETAKNSTKRTKLTNAERAQLVASLKRLANALIAYQATLVAVDEAVMELPEAERPRIERRGDGGRSSLAAVAADAAADIEVEAEEIIEEITDDSVVEEIEDTIDEIEAEFDDIAEAVNDAATDDDTNATSTDDMTGDDTTTDESNESTTTDDTFNTASEDSSDTTDEPMVDVEVDAEATVETGTPTEEESTL